jgi:hypothetical protein
MFTVEVEKGRKAEIPNARSSSLKFLTTIHPD